MNAEDLLREAHHEAASERSVNYALLSIAQSLIDLVDLLRKTEDRAE